MKKIFYFFAATLLFLSSCGVKYATIPYFTDLPSGNLAEDINNQTILKIQKDDILAITVSSLSAEANAIFNTANNNGGQQSTGQANPIIGFIVDKNGSVQLPYLGAVKVEGLTTAEARAIIQNKLNEGNILKQAVVSLRLANFKVSVLGDVARPGVYPVQSERVTVIEALGMAGDLNITAKRNDILLIRENLGKRQQIRIDLQSKDLFNSPYYYLENNDVLVVTPSAAKYASVDSSYRNVSIIISALSIIAIFITRL
jgi:polysaccharide export outer membrane protein